MNVPSFETLGLPPTGLCRCCASSSTSGPACSIDNGRGDLLGERMAPLVVERGFRSFLDLYYLLKYDEAGGTRAWRQVMDALSVQETYFWREIDQIRAVVDHLVPALAARGAGPIRIWCAPCATGEEPLTIAMMLNETGWFDRARIEIHGSDGSQAAVAKAREGRYRQRSMRALPPDLREKYFDTDGNGLCPMRRR